MNFNITIVERMVLESIHQKPKATIDLELCTGLQRDILQSILISLISKGLVNTDLDSNYAISNLLSPQIKEELYDSANTQVEINEIINSCSKDKTSSTSFKLKKVHLNEKEEKILNSMLYNIESFLDSLPKNNQSIASKNVIFWGGSKYDQIIHNTLNY